MILATNQIKNQDSPNYDSSKGTKGIKKQKVLKDINVIFFFLFIDMHACMVKLSSIYITSANCVLKF